jgi:hypothetical protein
VKNLAFLMLIKAALLPGKLVISSFVNPFYYGSDSCSNSAKAKSYGSYSSGSATLDKKQTVW